MTVDQEIKVIIAKYGISNQKELADDLGISEGYISKWKRTNYIPDEFREKISKLYVLNDVGVEDIQKIREDIVSIPYLSDTYGDMGGGAINYDNAPTPMMFDRTFMQSQLGISACKNIHIINAVGNSMEPTIKSGELLFVNPIENENTMHDHGIYVIQTQNGTLVKRIRISPNRKEWTLISDNPKVPEYVITGDEIEACRIIGRVVGHFNNL